MKNMTKVVVITGASSGLGLSHAIYLTYKGYTVFGTSRKEKQDVDELKTIFLRDHTKWRFDNKEKTVVKKGRLLLPKKLVKNLDKLITQIQFFKLDVTSKESVKTAIEKMNTEAKALNNRGIDVLINNAGFAFFESAEELPIEAWEKTFDINFFGALRVIKEVLPDMKKRREGRIINTSSLAGLATVPFQTHYCSSKAAIIALTQGLRVETKEFNIKASAILPSDINTSFNKNTIAQTNQKDNSLTSIDLAALIDNNPVNEKSDYFTKSQKVWKTIILNLIVSPPPIRVSRKIARIIKAKRPKINYLAGSFAQRFLVFLIRRIVSDEFTYWLLPKYYGM